jgi:hypothetical protein
MMAPLIAPIEVPMTQFGSIPASWSALINTTLICAERASTLKYQHHLTRKRWCRPRAISHGVHPWSRSRIVVVQQSSN